MAQKELDPEDVWTRRRGWLLFNVSDPSAAAERVSRLFAEGEEWSVVIRADVVVADRSNFNLVVPVDSALVEWGPTLDRVQGAVAQEPVFVAYVSEYRPAIPHRASCFITKSDFEGYPLPEYSPPGRHPKSPGANPWG